LPNLALGWMILAGVRPMLGSVDALTALLIGVGGVLYSIGVGFHLRRALPIPQRDMAQLRAGRSRLSLLQRFCMAWSWHDVSSGGIIGSYSASVAGEAKA